jgi:ABC-2 type transport system permease protein
MKRYARLIAMFMRLNLVGLMEFKADFFIELGVHAFFQATNLVFFGVLWGRVGGFGGLAPKEMLFFLGTFIIADSLFAVFGFFGILDLPNTIKDGGIDLCLTKPVSSQAYVTLRYPSVLGALSIILGAVLIGVALASGEVRVPPIAWLGWAALVVMGAAISYSMGVIVMSLSFITLSVNALWTLYSDFTDVQRYPVGVFPQPWRTLFTITLPVVLVANVPARFALSKVGPLELAWFVAASAALVFASTRVWKYGLKRYQSASS